MDNFLNNYHIKTNGEIISRFTNRSLKWIQNTSGYPTVFLYDGKGNRTQQLVHRLVALRYLPNPEGLPEVNHIDEDKWNPDITNLEWCDTAYNVSYSQASTLGFTNPEGTLEVIHNLSQFCRDNGLDQGAMSKVHLGQRNSHKGWTKG